MKSAQISREQTKTEPDVDRARRGRAPVTGARCPLTFNDAHSPVLRLDHTTGSRIPLPRGLQAKLTVNESGDQYEQEADRVAEQVMRMPVPTLRLQRKCGCGGSISSGESCEECAGGSGQLQRRAMPRPESESKVPDIVHDVIRSPGHALGQDTRSFFEQRFGQDFSKVRIHTDDRAAKSTRAVNALAYTVGQDVVFGTGQYAPTTNTGQRILAHELTHVVQQRSASSFGALRRGEADHPSEREADAAASSVMIGLPIQLHQEGRILRRYGHTPSCDTKTHLMPFVWPGHDHAKKVAQRAAEETDGRKLHPKVAMLLTNLFGKNAGDPATVAKINQNFVRIQASLNEQYLYHCASNNVSPEDDAVKCKNQNASTNFDGRQDITLCFDQLKGWSVPAAAWVIVHENVHRVLGPGHDWEAGNVDRCVLKPPAPENLQLKNPDAYACFAVLMWNLG